MHLALVHYDPGYRRLWLRGQRCHHGATGVLLAGAGVAGAAMRSRRLATLIAAGALLMAHDWHDRAVWFARGWQD
jgi:hypothetical protein